MRLSKTARFVIVLAAFLVLGISFKVMVLVEGLTEVRPVNAIPVVAGLTCGMIGALACGMAVVFRNVCFRGGGGWVKEIYIYIFFNNSAFSVGLGMPILIILTSEGIDIECCRPPERYLLIGKRQARKAACMLYLCFMLLLLAAVLVMELGPAEAEWMLPLSAAALAVLSGQLI